MLTVSKTLKYNNVCFSMLSLFVYQISKSNKLKTFFAEKKLGSNFAPPKSSLSNFF
jgi:hypothetical protein